MFEGQPGDVFASFKGELEREREEVPLTKVGDLVCKEPGVFIERCLSGDGEAIGMQDFFFCSQAATDLEDTGSP